MRLLSSFSVFFIFARILSLNKSPSPPDNLSYDLFLLQIALAII